MTETPLLREMIAFAVGQPGSEFPDLARRRAADAITDCIACILAGAGEDCARLLHENVPTAVRPSGLLKSWIWKVGYGTAADSALCNGTAAHALDYDDTNHPAYAHPSAVLVPALLALAPHSAATGVDAINAYIVGLEMIGKLGRVLNNGHYIKGWHATGTFGAPAAALACAHLLRLSADETGVALAIAASGASGIRANFGTMVKPLHAGQAARTGVLAVLLARQGYDAAPDAFDHRFGYLATFAGGEAPMPDVLRRPGDELEILTPYGLALKPNPSCGATHPGIEAAASFKGRFPIEEIAAIRVGVPEMALNPLIHDRPSTPLEGKFSMQYCVAAALLDGAVTLATFTEQRMRDPKLSGLMERVRVEVDERVRHDPEFATCVRVETSSGRAEERIVQLAKGKPERWLSSAELEEKVRDCARFGGMEVQAAAEVLSVLREIDTPVPFADLVERLSRFQRP